MMMAELDVQRRADLLKYIGGSEQAFVHDNSMIIFETEFVETVDVWRVENQKVEK